MWNWLAPRSSLVKQFSEFALSVAGRPGRKEGAAWQRARCRRKGYLSPAGREGYPSSLDGYPSSVKEDPSASEGQRKGSQRPSTQKDVRDLSAWQTVPSGNQASCTETTRRSPGTKEHGFRSTYNFWGSRSRFFKFTALFFLLLSKHWMKFLLLSIVVSVFTTLNWCLPM